MKRLLVTAVLPLLSLGCSGEIKAVMIDQMVGFLSTVSAALATSLLEGLLSGVSA
jgi:hypothetical protein